MDNTDVRSSFDHAEISGRSADKKVYESPALYVYGALDDLTEYVGIVNSDGPVGSSGAP